jgi:3-hydroxyisobutyrate dehydrogenase-like beta-hydroxyacid dehydrogenase
MSDRWSIGVIGLGNMGSRIAAKLLEAGHEVHVWDRSPEAGAELVGLGAMRAETPTELATRIDVGFSVLATDDAVRAVVIDSGLLASLPDGAVFADLSTTSIELAVALGAAGRDAGIDVLDIEMSGSTQMVEAGKLVLFVGGDVDVLQRVRPLLDPIAGTILHMGPHGAGAKMKLAVNLLLGVEMEAIAEAIAFGEAVGLDRDRLLEGLEHVAVISPAHVSKLANAQKNEYPVAFALRLMHKDFGLILRSARELGLELPATVASAEVCAIADEAAASDEDFSAVIRQLETNPLVRPA